MALPATTDRVTRNTSPKRNRQIRQEMERRLWYYLDHPQEIEQRLEELDHEWDMERVLEANAATLGVAGVLLSAAAGRRFLFIPGIVTAFLLQHALQGWCPPVPLFRRLGYRTQSEIELERYALKALRGDFAWLERAGDAGEEHREYPAKVLRAMTRGEY